MSFPEEDKKEATFLGNVIAILSTLAAFGPIVLPNLLGSEDAKVIAIVWIAVMGPLFSFVGVIIIFEKINIIMYIKFND